MLRMSIVLMMVLASVLARGQEGVRGAAFLGFGYVEGVEGFKITRVLEGSPAESAGLRVGDVIREVEGKRHGRDDGKLTTDGLLQTLWFSKKVVFRVRRDGEDLGIETSLSELDKVLEVGDAAPDFTLKTPDQKTEVTLSKLIGKRPIVIVFGSYT